MTNSTETRKLAAVLFADIEGYTAQFQSNESVAIHQVEDHRHDLEEVTTKHRGHIIQFYGDGSVTIFDSVVDAALCAIALQKISRQHRIPIRIGIHMGDLIYKGGDIYGDVVNIASRIQSLGSAGSVLVSKKVMDELRNHPEFQSLSLGHFSLKNVFQKIELFALTGHGLSIPKTIPENKKSLSNFSTIYWLFLLVIVIAGLFLYQKFFRQQQIEFDKERIVIPPFKDLTQDPRLSTLSELASSYLTKVINETRVADVVSNENSIIYTNADITSITSNPNLAKRLGATMMLNGSYSLYGPEQDSLLMLITILDLKSMKSVNFSIPEFRCSASDHMVCLNEMADVLKGYWKSKKYNFFVPPTDKALLAYLNAVKIWADPARNTEAKQFAREAISLDPRFTDAYFLFLDALNNDNDYQDEADTIEWMKAQLPEMDDRQQNFLNYYIADLNGKNKEAFSYYLDEYRHRPKEIIVSTDGMVLATEYLNDPETTLLLNQDLNLDSLDLNTCIYCHTRVSMALSAYLSLHEYDRAGKLVEMLRPYAKRRGQFARMISYYIAVTDTASILSLIEKSNEFFHEKDNAARFHLLTARIAYAQQNLPLSISFAKRAASYYKDSVNIQAARTLNLLGDLKGAEKILTTLIKTDPDDEKLYAELGIVYAKSGNKKEAEKMIQSLDRFRGLYDYGQIHYYQGRIKANMKEIDEALSLLQLSLEEGIKFKSGSFQEDPDLVVINTSPVYRELLTRNKIKR